MTPPNPPPEPMSGPQGLRTLAAWFDVRTDLFPGADDGVQRDLRRWADDMETARARIDALEAELERARLWGFPDKYEWYEDLIQWLGLAEGSWRGIFEARADRLAGS